MLEVALDEPLSAAHAGETTKISRVLKLIPVHPQDDESAERTKDYSRKRLTRMILRERM